MRRESAGAEGAGGQKRSGRAGKGRNGARRCRFPARPRREETPRAPPATSPGSGGPGPPLSRGRLWAPGAAAAARSCPARPPPHPGSGNRALPAAATRGVRGGSHRRAGNRGGKFAGLRPARVSAPRSPGPTRQKAANERTFASSGSAETFLKSHSVPGRLLLGFGRVLRALSAFGFCHSLSFVPFLISANVFIFLPVLFPLPLEVSSRSWGSVEFLFVFPRPPGKEFKTF